jgi:hypothetical protein
VNSLTGLPNMSEDLLRAARVLAQQAVSADTSGQVSHAHTPCVTVTGSYNPAVTCHAVARRYSRLHNCALFTTRMLYMQSSPPVPYRSRAQHACRPHPPRCAPTHIDLLFSLKSRVSATSTRRRCCERRRCLEIKRLLPLTL